MTDGDTIRVLLEGTEVPVRYIGIDTPEPDAADPLEKQHAEAATAANSALVAGREVVLERDVSETDRFDRLLRHVWIVDGTAFRLVTLELVSMGLAQVSSFPPDLKYQDLFAERELEAQTAALGLWEPAPTLAPAATPVVAVADDLVSIVADDRERFDGAVGLYTWNAMSFESDRVTIRWTVRAAAETACRVAWQVQPASGSPIKSTVRVDAGDAESGNSRHDTTFSGAVYVVDSTCPGWTMSMQGANLPPPGDDGETCDPSYPDSCIPPYPPDLDCGDIADRRFTVVGSDPHGFDGNNDGVGCESG